MQNKLFIAIVALAVIGVGAWWVFSQQDMQQPEQEGMTQEEQQGQEGMTDGNGNEQNPDGQNSGGQPGDQTGSDNEVIVRATENGYVPDSVTISTGTTVTFVNESSRPVWTASDVHPTHQIMPEFDALEGIPSGESYSFTFEEAGTWRYHDHLRPQHGGTITVE